ncbi:MAG TPA: Uma2 family endonuclease [Acidobacteriaceae bacterium]|nr:Uma2 family endonuclease [Acidobacteriaceae bacterium]
MTSATQIPVSEYLQTAFRPDREYVDGEILERNVGKWQHARIQWLLALWFGRHESQWNVIGSTEQRVSVSPTRVRVPDLVVLRPGPQPDVLIEPPLLIIEVLSPDDNYSDLEERCRDYLQMGVEVVWIIDPKTRSGRMCLENRWVAARRLEVRNTPIYVDLEELFDQIDTPSPS